MNRYRDQTDAVRARCGESLAEARELLLAKKEEYEAVTGEDPFEVALQSFRIGEQFHLHVTGQQHRDKSMAENTEWIMRRIGPEARMVLWAHNYHGVDHARNPGWLSPRDVRRRHGGARLYA